MHGSARNSELREGDGVDHTRVINTCAGDYGWWYTKSQSEDACGHTPARLWLPLQTIGPLLQF